MHNTVVVYSTPAIRNIIIWWDHNRVVDHYSVFSPTKSARFGALVLHTCIIGTNSEVSKGTDCKSSV